MESIAGLMGLQSLKLNETAVTDAGLLRLKGSRNLKYVEVHQTRVSEEGIAKLREALPKVEVIRHRNY
jgi:hypothetical protein